MAVDDLFDGRDVEVVDPLPRLRLWLYWTGVLVFGGLCCFSGPFGALASIWVWARAGDEIERAESGLGPPGTEAGARSIRNQAFGLMVFSLLSLIAQCTGYIFLGSMADLVQTIQTWIAEILARVVPEEGLSTGAKVAGFLLLMLVMSTIFGTLHMVLRTISERAVFGDASPRKSPPRRPLPPVPHESMQAYVDKELALRAAQPEGAVVHPELGVTADGQRYTLGEWAFAAAEETVLPEGLTFLVITVPTADGGAESLVRDPRAVLKLLGKRVRRGESPCPHVRVHVFPHERPAVLDELRKLPEFKP